MTRTKRTRRIIQLGLLLASLVALTRPSLASTADASAACALCIGYDICASHHEGTDTCYVIGGVCDQFGSSCS